MPTRHCLTLCFALCACLNAWANEDREVSESVIHAGIEEVWAAFTTTEGLQSWVSPIADIDFRVGGKWRVNYNPEGTLGDDNTIENTILSYDPKRMLSLKATGFPAGFEFAEAAAKTWSVFYFKSLTEDTTSVTIVGLGYDDTEASQKMRSFFESANAYSMGQLNAALSPDNPRP